MWIVLVACLVVGVAGGVWLEPRLHAFLVDRAGGSAWRGALVAFLVHLAALLVFGLAAAVGLAADGTTARVVVGAATVAYAPVLLCAMPSKYTGYREQRAELRRAGARVPVDRGIAWAGGPVALVGCGLLFATVFAAFDA